MDVARRVGVRKLEGKPLSLADRLRYGLSYNFV